MRIRVRWMLSSSPCSQVSSSPSSSERSRLSPYSGASMGQHSEEEKFLKFEGKAMHRERKKKKYVLILQGLG